MISLAVQQNVVVMRTWDLYRLLGVKLDGGAAAAALIAAIVDTSQGGWLRLSEDGSIEVIAA